MTLDDVVHGVLDEAEVLQAKVRARDELLARAMPLISEYRECPVCGNEPAVWESVDDLLADIGRMLAEGAHPTEGT